MSDANHPIWDHFRTNPNNSLTCLECGFIYRIKPKSTTLKSHFVTKHPDTWKKIRKNEKGYKRKNKEKNVLVQEEEENSNSNIELSDNWTEENNQKNNQEIQNNIQENLNNNFTNRNLNIIKNIEIENNEKIEIKIENNKISISGRCKIEFK
ncbi:882_t:CDS:1 [Scutellospora calospora]|uniref:882_t:CDS:1 n=1 Tax=Scutellospora calospora TaxID=85575 RepID=A0ACA9KIV4_9GLOM|nr:882_t:CDS:1 [Scutellospora calospora]